MSDKTEQTAAWLETFAREMRRDPGSWPQKFAVYDGGEWFLPQDEFMLTEFSLDEPHLIRRAQGGEGT